VRALPGDKIIRSLASFRSISWDAKIGEYQAITIDCFTRYFNMTCKLCCFKTYSLIIDLVACS